LKQELKKQGNGSVKKEHMRPVAEPAITDGGGLLIEKELSAGGSGGNLPNRGITSSTPNLT